MNSHPLHRVVTFDQVGVHSLRVEFDDGSRQTIDFTPVLAGELYEPLQDPDLFAQVRLDPEVHTIVWPNGADFDPATLHDWPLVVKELAARARTWTSTPVDQTRNPIAKQKDLMLRLDEDREAIIGSQGLLSSDYDPRSVARRLQQPPNQNAQVWRYMPFARFVWLLLKKQLWFSRGDLLGDKHEALLSGSPLSVGLRERADPAAREEWLMALKRLRSKLYVSCWHLAEHESLAMWRLYCGANDGVAIVTSYQALQEAVAPLPVGLVTHRISTLGFLLRDREPELSLCPGISYC